MHQKRTAVAILVGAIGTLLVLAAAGLIIVWTGAYNVAATDGHLSFVRWSLDTTMHNSVKGRASDLRPPERFTAEMLAAGAGEYKAMCQQCHAGPGVDRADWAEGMLPQPPHLTEAAAEWRTREIFWIAKHGIKMTGMPAFGPTHEDATLWNIAGFVSQLPGMTSEQYAALPGGHGHARGSRDSTEPAHEAHSH